MSDDRDPSPDRAADDAVDEWVETVAAEADREGDGEDPFDRIGEGSGPRHGDPFDAFESSAAETGDAVGSAEETGDTVGSDEDPDEARADPAREGLPAGSAEDDPFVEFDEPTTDPFGEGDTTFAGVDVGDLEDDGVWERIESIDAEATAVPGKRYVDVNKHSYCEGCEHFSEPPDVACSHEGTDILEFVDMETIRVLNCPVVDERKALEDID